MVSELKPCPLPWCQGDAQHGVGHIWRHIECSLCGVEGPAHKTETEAITAWNTRTPDPEALEAAFRLGLEAAAGVARGSNIWDHQLRKSGKDLAKHILAIDPAQHLGRE